VLVERGQHALHRLGDRVVCGEVVAAEQGVEHRPGDEVLGEHLDGVVAGDAVVEVAAQAGEERVELRCCAVRAGEQALDAHDVLLRDLGDVLGPVLPIAALADLGDDLGVDRLAPALDVERQLRAVPSLPVESPSDSPPRGR
jgi:hypothetical protein